MLKGKSLFVFDSRLLPPNFQEMKSQWETQALNVFFAHCTLSHTCTHTRFLFRLAELKIQLCQYTNCTLVVGDLQLISTRRVQSCLLIFVPHLRMPFLGFMLLAAVSLAILSVFAMFLVLVYHALGVRGRKGIHSAVRCW